MKSVMNKVVCLMTLFLMSSGMSYSGSVDGDIVPFAKKEGVVLIGNIDQLDAEQAVVAEKDWAFLFYAYSGRWTDYYLNILTGIARVVSGDTVPVLAFNKLGDTGVLLEVGSGAFTILESEDEVGSDEAHIERLMQLLVAKYPGRNYGLILSGDGPRGDGSALVFDKQAQQWKSDQCWLYDRNRGTWLLPGRQSGMLISDFPALGNRIKNNIGRPLDLLVCDMRSLSSLEFAASIASSVRYLVGAEHLQIFEGFDYKKLMGTLIEQKLSADQCGSVLVQSMLKKDCGEKVKQAGAAFAVQDCAMMQELWVQLQSFAEALCAIEDQGLRERLYNVRCHPHSVDYSDYRRMDDYAVDMRQWLLNMREVFLHAQKEGFVADSYIAALDDLQRQLTAGIVASSDVNGGVDCGVSLYYPTLPNVLISCLSGAWYQYINRTIEALK